MCKKPIWVPFWAIDLVMATARLSLCYTLGFTHLEALNVELIGTTNRETTEIWPHYSKQERKELTFSLFVSNTDDRNITDFRRPPILVAHIRLAKSQFHFTVLICASIWGIFNALQCSKTRMNWFYLVHKYTDSYLWWIFGYHFVNSAVTLPSCLSEVKVVTKVNLLSSCDRDYA